MKRPITSKIVSAVAGTLALASISACSRSNLSALGAWGQPALVEEFSGGQLVFAGISTGKIEDEGQSDGYYFSNACDGGTLVEVSGQVVITRPTSMPTCAQVLAASKAPKFNS